MNRADALAEVERIEASLAALRALLSDDTGDTPSAPVAPVPAARRGLSDAAAFFDAVRRSPPLGPGLSQDEVDGCVAVLGACVGWPASWAAYALATAVHETAGTLKPIREYGKGHGRPYGVPDASGQIPYGRGYVQLTWPANYAKADAELGLNGALIADYDLALDPAIASKILVRGMDEGWFTGKALQNYLPPVATRDAFKQARRIINGTDKADLIAGYAETFQAALQAGGWA